MLDKFLIGNKQIPEMYFGNIPVAKIYFGTTLIWEKEGYVPYDSTCTLIIDGDSNTQKFSVQVMKNGVDVTSSLDHYTDFSYIVNDVLPSYRITNQTVTDKNEVSITDLINKYKQTESISDTRYDNTKGEFSYAGCRVYSKAGGSFLDSGSVTTQNNIVIPYTLTEDNSTNDLWIVVSQNVSNTPVEIKTLQVATTYVGAGATSIHIFHESGLLVYRYDSNWYTPSSTQKTISGQTYNYLTIDLTALSTGTFKLKRFEKYYIKIKHSNNNNNHYYYRNGGILGIVGYVTGNINLPNNTYDLNSLTYDGVETTETDFLDKVNTNNHYAKYTGTSNIFSTNNIYKCKKSFVFRGVLSDSDIFVLAANDGEVGYYSGPASELGVSGAFVKSGVAIWVTATDTPSTIYTENDSTKIFKFTGNTTADIFVKNRFYSCNTPTTVKAEITSAPSADSVSVDDIYFATSGIYSDPHSTGWNGTGFYKVTSVTKYTADKTFNSNPVTYNDISDVNVNGIIHYTGNYWNDGWAGEGYYRLVSKDSSSQTYSVTKLTDPNYVVQKQNQPVTDETNNMKAKLLSFNTNDYYDVMNGTDTNLSTLTIITDHKHEILMGN